MAHYISGTPLWVIIFFIGSFLISIAVIANTAKQIALGSGMTIGNSKNIWSGVFIFFVIWLTYASALSLNGILSVNSLPPRAVLFNAGPLLIILFLVIGNTGLYKRLLRAAPLESLIRLHVFRVVGVFFLVIYFYHLMPARFAFSAGMGDIVTALLAIPVAKAIAQKKSWSIKAAYAWNFLGLLDIVTAVVLAVVTARADMATGAHGDQEMTLFPFVWFPAFAPATILFLHAGIFSKLRQLKQQQI